MMSGIILLSSKGKAPGLLRIRLATASLLAMTGEKTFYEAVKFDIQAGTQLSSSTALLRRLFELGCIHSGPIPP